MSEYLGKLRIIEDWKENKKKPGFFECMAKIKIKDLVDGFVEDIDTNSAFTMNCDLCIRPRFQRNFVYKKKKSMQVIETILGDFGIGEFAFRYREGKAGNYNFDVIDGQQRIISICKYHENEYPYKEVTPIGENSWAYRELRPADKEIFDNFEITVKVLKGSDRDILDYFQIINIAGEQLRLQEIRNSYATIGEYNWIDYAKSYFSIPNRGADDKRLGYYKFVDGAVDRQDILEKAIKWHSASLPKYKDITNNDERIKAYMCDAAHNSDDAMGLKKYYNNVMHWVERMFIGGLESNYRNNMKKIEWGFLYNTYKDSKVPPKVAQRLVSEIYCSPMVDLNMLKSNIYAYVLSCDENGENGDIQLLSLREFDRNTKLKKWREQGCKCAICHEPIGDGEYDAHHINAWRDGGASFEDNCQILCKKCHSLETKRQQKRWSEERIRYTDDSDGEE